MLGRMGSQWQLCHNYPFDFGARILGSVNLVSYVHGRSLLADFRFWVSATWLAGATGSIDITPVDLQSIYWGYIMVLSSP